MAQTYPELPISLIETITEFATTVRGAEPRIQTSTGRAGARILESVAYDQVVTALYTNCTSRRKSVIVCVKCG